ncbi:MAG: glycerate kinase [Fusobacteria bacterium]|nr:glycerate kinase [Fusobacteriota bacterium]
MKYIVCPDSFKDSMSAVDVCEIIAAKITERFPNAQVIKIPLSDGGEGFVASLAIATQSEVEVVEVRDALLRPIDAHYLLLDEGKTAVLELAQANGLEQIPINLRNPLKTSSYGTGKMIQHVLECGVSKIIIGLGGSATNDGGMGLLQALGARFYDCFSQELPGCGANLKKIENIDVSNIDPRLQAVELIIATDVENLLLGKNGATWIYGPQKGATLEMCEKLESGMTHFALKLEKLCQCDLTHCVGGGAAGGVGAVLIELLRGKRVSGIEWLLDKVEFSQKVMDTDIVITGEGCVDLQTFNGKLVSGIIKMVESRNIKLIIMAGHVKDEARKFENASIKMFQITPIGQKLKNALIYARVNLSECFNNFIK